MNTPRLVRTGVGLGAVFFDCALPERGEPNDKLFALVVAGTGVACMVSVIFLKDLNASNSPARQWTCWTRCCWTGNDAFTVRDLLNGGVAIFGRTGSGKTSSSGKALARAIVSNGNNGGLILAAKPEDMGMWQAIFAEAGRCDDLLIFSPDTPLRFNFLGKEMRAEGHTRNITKCIPVIGETLRSSDSTAGKNADFWQRELERMIFNAVEIVKQSTGKVGAPELPMFISTAAMNPGTIATAEWQAGFHNQCLKAAWEKQKTTTEEHDFELAEEFWLGEFPRAGASKKRRNLQELQRFTANQDSVFCNTHNLDLRQ